MELPVTKMSRIVMPASTNDAGNLYGGRLLDWMDEVSGIAAKRFAHSEVMTVGIESIRFMRPMPQGSFIDINAEVVHVGNTSMKIKITVMMDQDPEEIEDKLNNMPYVAESLAVVGGSDCRSTLKLFIKFYIQG